MRGRHLTQLICRILVLSVLSLSLLLTSSIVPAVAAQPALLVQKIWGGSIYDQGLGVAVDSSGNMYVTGETNASSPMVPGGQALLLKYDTAGTLLWQRIWSGSGNGSDVGRDVAVDASGNIYVTGLTFSFGAGGEDVLLLKFYSNGTLAWQRTWGGSNADEANSIALDSSGNVYVAGSTLSFGAGSWDVLLLKFNSTGALTWQKTWGGSDIDQASEVAVDVSGNIYVAGDTFSFGAGSSDVFLLKFDSSGDLLWQRTWGGSNGDYGLAAAVDASGEICVSGWTETGSAGVLLLKFDSSGGLLWQKNWHGVGHSDLSSGVAVDSSGDIYTTGFARDFGARGVFLLKLDPSGNLLWEKNWGGSIYDQGWDVAVTAYGDAVVTGSVDEAGPYTLSSPNGTVGSLAGNLGAPNFNLGTPTFTLHSPKGTLQTPSGNESYAGMWDVFLIKSGPSGEPPSLPVTPAAILLGTLAAPIFFILSRRRKGRWLSLATACPSN